MKILARLDDAASPPAPYEPALLLEGCWPAGQASANRFSLDEQIDAREGWIDEEATRLATLLIGRAATPTWRTFLELNQLKLRYFLVKLLRPIAFFRHDAHAPAGGCLQSCGASVEHDDVYGALLQSLATARGWKISACTMGIPARREAKEVVGQECPTYDQGMVGQECPTYKERCRRWAGRVLTREPEQATDRQAPIVFCGNRWLLEPVCRELLRRGCATAWLYERFAFKTWLRLGRRGVRQWTCDQPSGQTSPAFDGPPLIAPFVSRGVDLSHALNLWLVRTARTSGARQQAWLTAINEHFARRRPAAVVLDEDATPFARAAILAARKIGVPSIVAQHGVPRVRFGFAPPLADALCAWGESSRRQLLAWGAEQERVHVCGAPFVREPAARAARRVPAAPEVLFLATTPPTDSRPDAVSFHLTTQTHEQLLRLACRAVARLHLAHQGRARLTIKLHPRCRDRRPFARIAAEYPALRVRIVVGGSLDRCLRQADCVLNCTSSAGIEAARAGHRVIELIPAGGDDLLPAADWGTLGTARDDGQLDALLQRALAVPTQLDRPSPSAEVFAAVGDDAAARVADAVLRECAGERRRTVLPPRAARPASIRERTAAEEVAASL